MWEFSFFLKILHLEESVPGNFWSRAFLPERRSRSRRRSHWVDLPARSRPSMAMRAPRVRGVVEAIVGPIAS